MQVTSIYKLQQRIIKFLILSTLFAELLTKLELKHSERLRLLLDESKLIAVTSEVFIQTATLQ